MTADEPAAAAEVANPGEEAHRTPRRPAARPRRGPRVRTKPDAAAPAESAVEAPAPRTPIPLVKPVSPGAQVEAAADTIIIRFPPVAPPPFLPSEPEPELPQPPQPKPAPAMHAPVRPPRPVEPPVERVEDEAPEPPEPELIEPAAVDSPIDDDAIDAPEQPADAVAEDAGPATPTAGGTGEPQEGRGGRRRRRRGRRRGKGRPVEGEPEAVQPAPAEPLARPELRELPDRPERPQRPEPPQPVEGDLTRLSASQRRRLRRRRRSERSREQGPRTQPPERPREPRPVIAAPAGPRPAPAQPEAPPPPPDNEPWTYEEAQDASATELDAEHVETDAPRVGFHEFDASEDEPEAAGARPTKEMIINVFPREECRIAILNHGLLEEIYIERASSENHVGNIYKGVVTNVEPSIQAAFVDFGLGKNGFLHISDLHPQYFPNGGQPAENVGCKIPRRNRPPIQRCLRRGQQVIVQITKEGIGTKGPTLSTYVSIPGRFLVMMPGMRRLGVSRKIEDDDTRHKLRSQLAELELPDGVGFIARTAAQGRTKRELQSDLRYLVRLWRAVEKRIKEDRAPAELYRESDLVIRTIRDLYAADIGRIIVDDPAVAARAREFLRIFSPRSGDVVAEYTDSEPAFHKYGVEAELERLHSRHVPLKSGGSLVIEPTEALVAIDVNSGRFRTEDDAENTAFKLNLEAADEIARQLRLRDLGGVIICDFIDMRIEAHKREVERRLAHNLKEHKERAKILRMSAFGIIEMTRQRQRASLTRNVYQDCHHCRGTGLVRTAESVTLDVIRALKVNVVRENVSLIEVTVAPEVAAALLNRKRALLHDLESQHRRTITIQARPDYGLDQVELRCWDQRGRTVPQA